MQYISSNAVLQIYLRSFFFSRAFIFPRRICNRIQYNQELFEKTNDLNVYFVRMNVKQYKWYHYQHRIIIMSITLQLFSSL